MSLLSLKREPVSMRSATGSEPDASAFAAGVSLTFGANGAWRTDFFDDFLDAFFVGMGFPSLV